MLSHDAGELEVGNTRFSSHLRLVTLASAAI